MHITGSSISAIMDTREIGRATRDVGEVGRAGRVFRGMAFLLLFFVSSLYVSTLVSAWDTPGREDYGFEQLMKFMALGTGASTGTYFPLGRAFADVWTTRLDDIDVMAHSTGGSVDNINLMRRGELCLAIAQSDVVFSALQGTGNFRRDPYTDLRILMSLFPEVIHVVVPADSDVESIMHIRNRSVIVGAPGSGNALTTLELLSVFDIGPEDFEPVFLSFDEAVQAMTRGEYDAAVIIAGIPTRAVSELYQRMGIRLLSFTERETELIISALPYLYPITLSAGTYREMQQPVSTLALSAMLIGNTDLDDDLAHTLIKAIFDNLDYLRRVHERAGDISVQSFRQGIPDRYLHGGARRY